MYQRYGYGGLYYPTYDLGGPIEGCVNKAGATPLNTIANLELRGMVWLDAIGGFLHRVGQTRAWWDALDPVVTSGQVLSQRLLWGPAGIISLALLCLACLLAWMMFQGKVSVVLKLTMIAIGVLFIGHATAFKGIETVHWLRDNVTGFTAAFDDQGRGETDSDIVHRELLYRTWLAGMFGDADSPVAKEYGPKLFDCMTYRWDDNPDDGGVVQKITGGGLLEQKQLCYRKTMEDLSKNHPVEADYAKGRKSDAQAITGLLGLVGMAATMFWQIWAGLAAIVLNLMLTAVVPAASFVVPLALFKNGSKTFLRPLFDLVVGAAIRTVVCSITAQLGAAAVGAVLGAGVIPWLLRVVILVLIIATSLALTRRHRKLANGHVSAAALKTAGAVVDRSMQAATVAAGVAAGGVPLAIGEQFGKNKKDGGPAAAPAVTAANTATGQGHTPEGWVAPQAAIPAKTGVGRPPLAWEHAAGTVPAGALNVGPGAYRNADGYWVDTNRGTVPAGALGPGPLGLPPGDQVADGRRVQFAAAARRIRTAAAADGNALDRILTGTYVAESGDRPLFHSLDVDGWVAPPAGAIPPRPDPRNPS